MPVVHGELPNNMKMMIDGKEYEACITSPYENPKNPKYVLVNGYLIPVDTIGPHRPLPAKVDIERSVDGMYDLAIVSRGTKPIKTKPIVPRLISLQYQR
jgi:hypothetical protein